ncbi:MAG: cupin domain-containing protein [Acidobacteriota bacterium]
MASASEPRLYYPQVLDQSQNTIFSLETTPGLNKTEGFRIPLIYFSWAVLFGSRSSHHHPDNDELLLVLEGKAQITIVGPGKPKPPAGKPPRFKETYEVSTGDVVLFPQGWTHYVEEDPKNPLKVLVIFNNQDFKAVEHDQDGDPALFGENA